MEASSKHQAEEYGKPMDLRLLVLSADGQEVALSAIKSTLDFLGAAYSPLRVGTDLDNPSAPGFRVRAFDPIAGVPRDRLRGRLGLLGRLESAGANASTCTVSPG